MKYIYEPKGRAREYGALALNVYSNCDFGCLYCYCRGMGYDQTKTPHCRLDFKLLEADLEQVKGQTVFLCFT
ncbi:MAG: hypothetical protein QG670_628, partial [Thermoproteota archaeon]|nr:hypothetical protein [Thermoproteota archaeon]